MPFEIQPDPSLVARAKQYANNVLALAEPLQEAPTDLDVDDFLEWSEQADGIAQGILRYVSDLRAHYSRYIKKKDGTLVDRDRIPGL